MAPDRALAGRVRLAALVGAAALLVQGQAVLSIPAVLVGVGGALLAVRRVGRTPSEAQLPLGVALVASLLAALTSVSVGVPGLGLAALLAVGSQWCALRWCRELAARRRRTWGVQQLDVLRRQRELDDRRATGQPPAPPRDGAGGGPGPDATGRRDW